MRRGTLSAGAALLVALIGCDGPAAPDASTGSDAGGRDAGRGADASGADAGRRDAGEVPPRGDRLFPDGAWFYQDVSSAAVHARSAQTTQWLEDQGGFGTGSFRIDFSIVVLEAAADTENRSFEPTGDFYDPDCDEVPVPVPAGGALEGEDGYECASDGDCHLIVVDRRDDRLYEMWRANIVGGTFYGGCLAAWDMTRAYPPEGRGEQCTSADAAGFPIAPLLLTPEEVARAAAGEGEIDHAVRFILPNARMRAGYYVRPATHAGGPSATAADAPVYGTRWRLRADFDMSTLPNDAARAVARALQRYGMALADGGNIALTFESDRFASTSWEAVGLDSRSLDVITPNDFEVIDTGPPIELTYDCVRTPY